MTLLPNNSVRANSSGYMSTMPLAHVETTDTITVREYACGRFISLLRNGQQVRLRWMQRYLTNAEDGLAATWFLDDIKIRAWNGDCFVPLFVEDFATAASPPIDGTSYRIHGGGITENSCEGDCASGNSSLYFNQVGALRRGAYRRSLILLIESSDGINSCGTTSGECLFCGKKVATAHFINPTSDINFCAKGDSKVWSTHRLTGLIF